MLVIVMVMRSNQRSIMINETANKTRENKLVAPDVG